MAEAAVAQHSSSQTVTINRPEQQSRALVLRPQQAERPPQIRWEAGTVDNEHMNKKKSKCCCVYERPRTFNDPPSSDSDSDSEGGPSGKGDNGCTDNCCGHKDKCYRQVPQNTQE